MILLNAGCETAGSPRSVAHWLQTAAGKRLCRFVVPERGQLCQVGQMAPAADGERCQRQVKRGLCFSYQCQQSHASWSDQLCQDTE